MRIHLWARCMKMQVRHIALMRNHDVSGMIVAESQTMKAKPNIWRMFMPEGNELTGSEELWWS